MKLRFNPMENELPAEFDMELIREDGRKLWFSPRDESVDVVVVPIAAPKLIDRKMQFHWFHEESHVLPLASAKEIGVSEGDGVFVLGFPMGLVGQQRSYVVSRGGTIARIRDALAGHGREILIDATIFPGNSGGPVVLRPEAESIQGTNPISKADLIGIVSAYVPYQDVAISQQTRRPRIIFEENSGLGTVVPVDFIMQAITAHEEFLGNKSPTSQPSQGSLAPQSESSAVLVRVEKPDIQ